MATCSSIILYSHRDIEVPVRPPYGTSDETKLRGQPTRVDISTSFMYSNNAATVTVRERLIILQGRGHKYQADRNNMHVC